MGLCLWILKKKKVICGMVNDVKIYCIEVCEWLVKVGVVVLFDFDI